MIRLLTLGGLAIQRDTDDGADPRLTISKRNALLAYLAVERSTGESYLGIDTQLERAVEELLAQLRGRTTTSISN